MTFRCRRVIGSVTTDGPGPRYVSVTSGGYAVATHMLWNAERTWEAIRQRNRQRPANTVDRRRQMPQLTFPDGTGRQAAGARPQTSFSDPALARSRITHQQG